MMRNDVPLRVKNQTTPANAARRTIEARHCTGNKARAASPPPLSSVVGRSSSTVGLGDDPPERRGSGKPASRQAHVRPGHVKGSTQNQKPKTETIKEAQITVSYIFVTGGRPAMRI